MKIIPKDHTAEYFGFYDIFVKGAAFMETMMVGVATQLSGSSRTGVGLLAVLFVVGLLFFRISDKINRIESW